MHLFLVLAFLLISCSMDDNSIESQVNPIYFSESPIDLKGVDAKFAKDIAYDSKERTQFDIWLPNSDTPTGLVIYTHGGGFVSGDKDIVYTSSNGGDWDFPKNIRTLLENKIAFATIRYTYIEKIGETEGILKPMSDVKRALQYIKSRASDFNIEKSKIVLTGSSAGAGTSLWIAFNDDMSDPSSTDSVLQESTRVKGVAVRQTQASYNAEQWVNNIFSNYHLTLIELLTFAPDLLNIYGISSTNKYNTPEIVTYRKKVDMLALLTADDPEIWAENVLSGVLPPTTDRNVMNHHAFHVRALKDKADAVGVKNVCYYGKDPILYSDPSGEKWVEFLIRKVEE